MIAKLEHVLCLQYLLKVQRVKQKMEQKSKLGYALTNLSGIGCMAIDNKLSDHILCHMQYGYVGVATIMYLCVLTAYLPPCTVNPCMFNQWRIQDFEKGGSSVHVTDRIKCAKCAKCVCVCGTWGHVPSGKILISSLLRSLLVPLWQELDDQLPNLVIVFGACTI